MVCHPPVFLPHASPITRAFRVQIRSLMENGLQLPRGRDCHCRSQRLQENRTFWTRSVGSSEDNRPRRCARREMADVIFNGTDSRKPRRLCGSFLTFTGLRHASSASTGTMFASHAAFYRDAASRNICSTKPFAGYRKTSAAFSPIRASGGSAYSMMEQGSHRSDPELAPRGSARGVRGSRRDYEIQGSKTLKPCASSKQRRLIFLRLGDIITRGQTPDRLPPTPGRQSPPLSGAVG